MNVAMKLNFIMSNVWYNRIASVIFDLIFHNEQQSAIESSARQNACFPEISSRAKQQSNLAIAF